MICLMINARIIGEDRRTQLTPVLRVTDASLRNTERGWEEKRRITTTPTTQKKRRTKNEKTKTKMKQTKTHVQAPFIQMMQLSHVPRLIQEIQVQVHTTTAAAAAGSVVHMGCISARVRRPGYFLWCLCPGSSSVRSDAGDCRRRHTSRLRLRRRSLGVMRRSRNHAAWRVYDCWRRQKTGARRRRDAAGGGTRPSERRP